MAAGKKILEKSRPQVSVLDFEPAELRRRLSEKLQTHANVRAAFLHGSLAAGTAGPWSDIDLIIVADTAEPFIERPRAFVELLDLGVAVDLLVYTPAEFAELQHSGTWFWKEFRRHHQRLL
ncbi:MAG: nucleotidyltransferase domain-containing protein [Thermodesulfobacteriota bacterium]